MDSQWPFRDLEDEKNTRKDICCSLVTDILWKVADPLERTLHFRDWKKNALHFTDARLMTLSKYPLMCSDWKYLKETKTRKKHFDDVI
ncbi:hypothetical protein NPIL_99981 [Nephila pilipes]|uniref:Uncharacterized protein n=1 Tax=Nephila pilipes TaxID=299642 RepID=A0A8X6NRL6_NEPPI|nr:hypothetical protein NPIL_99981 [Nephila pilipes]